MERLTNLFTGHSNAGYSTWFLYQPLRLLLDCGEGCATMLQSRAFAAEVMLITHGHQDHISGLPAFFWTRGFGKGEKTKPLTIYFPEGDREIEAMRAYLTVVFPELPFPVKWVPARPGSPLPLDGRRHILPYPTVHEEGRLTLGYTVYEQRRQLNPTYSHLSTEEVKQRARVGDGDVMVKRACAILNYTGDTTALGVTLEADDLLLHECTFLDAADVKRNTHSVLDDVMHAAVQARPKRLVLFHFSIRYSAAMVNKAVSDWCRKNRVGFEVWVQYGPHLWPVFDPANDALPLDPDTLVQTETL